MKFKILISFLCIAIISTIAFFAIRNGRSRSGKSSNISKAGVSIRIGPRRYGYYGCYPYYYGYPSSGFNFGFYIGPRRRYYYYCPPGYYYRYYPRRYYYRDYRYRRYHKRKK